MPQIQICLFGPPRIEQNDLPISLGVRKGIALLVYLAVTRQPHSRDALATLFWPESNQQEARASLRRMLYRLNQIFKTDAVITERDLVQLDPALDLWVDVTEFRQSMATYLPSERGLSLDPAQRAQLQAAIDLYTDDFMAGFSLPDCAEFDEWQFFQREELRQSFAVALKQLMNLAEEELQYEQAISLARRWLALDRMHEPVHRHLMRLYACAGQQSAALRQYEECARILDEELGVEPADETTALFEAIRLRRFPVETGKMAKDPGPADEDPTLATHPPAPPSQALPSQALPASKRYPLPGKPLPLVGRDVELAQLRTMLANPHCRLITVVGIGGMGKTHLALEAAHQLAAQEKSEFPDGVLFVLLASKVNMEDPVCNLIFALIDALGLSLSGQEKPVDLLLDFLRSRKLLIILDNFEDLLHRAEEKIYTEPMLSFIEEILEQAPGVTLLVTSREPLQYQAEWRLNLQGLTYPSAEEQKDGGELSPHTYGAVHLFTQFARQVQPTFESTQQNLPAIYRLCRLVAGCPLALKLAAAWVRLFSCERIVADTEKNMDILSTQMRNVPARQRSMRAIFDYTWHLLSPEEQRLLLALSVFPGSFTEAAVTAIANATPHLLASLLDRGLLQVECTVEGMRHSLHALTRQYAAERLAADPFYAQQMKEQQARHYVNVLQGLREALVGKKQAEAVTIIHAEIDNIEMTWAHLLATGDLDSLLTVSEALWRYYWSRIPGHQGMQVFTDAIHYLAESEPAQAHPALPKVLRALYIMRGGFYYFLGDYDHAHSDFCVALELARQLGLRKEEMDAVVNLSSIAKWRGQIMDAQASLLEALAVYQEIGSRSGEADVHHELAQLYVYTGQYAEAQIHAAASYAISMELGRPDWIGWALDILGWLAFCFGDYTEAHRRYTESLSYFEQIGHQLGIALAWGGMGIVGLGQGGLASAEAQACMERSLLICRHIHHQFHISSRLSILTQIYNEGEQYAEAETLASEGLMLARKVGSPLYIALNLCGLAESLYYRGRLDQSRAHIREAIKVAYEASQVPVLTYALLCYATLLIIESELTEETETTPSSKQIQAVALLERVIHHPTGWAAYQGKANRLLNDLARKWPGEIFKAATLYNQIHSLDDQILEILQHEAAPGKVATGKVDTGKVDTEKTPKEG